VGEPRGGVFSKGGKRERAGSCVGKKGRKKDLKGRAAREGRKGKRGGNRSAIGGERKKWPRRGEKRGSRFLLLEGEVGGEKGCSSSPIGDKEKKDKGGLKRKKGCYTLSPLGGVRGENRGT